MINDFGPHAKPILIHRMINHHLSKHKSRVANVQASSLTHYKSLGSCRVQRIDRSQFSSPSEEKPEKGAAGEE